MHSLPLFHRISGKRVVVVGVGDMADAKARLVERAGGIPCAETEAHHAQLAFVALEDKRTAESAARRLKQAGLLVNVADQPDLCDFTLPSVLDRDPVLVAVSTGGASAGLAKHLRLRLEAILPQTLGTLATALFTARDRIRTRFPESNARRRAIDAALQEHSVLDPFEEASAASVENWLDGAQENASLQVVEFTIASDDPEDLTLRQARVLGKADIILHDAHIPDTILARARADAVRKALPADPLAEGFTVILRRKG